MQCFSSIRKGKTKKKEERGLMKNGEDFFNFNVFIRELFCRKCGSVCDVIVCHQLEALTAHEVCLITRDFHRGQKRVTTSGTESHLILNSHAHVKRNCTQGENLLKCPHPLRVVLFPLKLIPWLLIYLLKWFSSDKNFKKQIVQYSKINKLHKNK